MVVFSHQHQQLFVHVRSGWTLHERVYLTQTDTWHRHDKILHMASTSSHSLCAYLEGSCFVNMINNVTYLDKPPCVSSQLSQKTAIAVPTLGSILLYFEPIAHFAIFGFFPYTMLLHLVVNSLIRWNTKTAKVAFANNFA